LKAVKIGRAARQDWLFRALHVQLAPCEHEQLAAAVKLLSQRADFWSNGKEGERWTG
jgi:hypothetical protein